MMTMPDEAKGVMRRCRLRPYLPAAFLLLLLMPLDATAGSCKPKEPDALGPFYTPGGLDGGYGVAYRATVIADGKGAYRFESYVPPPYYGRPLHIHLRVSARGFDTLVTQHYPEEGRAERNVRCCPGPRKMIACGNDLPNSKR